MLFAFHCFVLVCFFIFSNFRFFSLSLCAFVSCFYPFLCFFACVFFFSSPLLSLSCLSLCSLLPVFISLFSWLVFLSVFLFISWLVASPLSSVLFLYFIYSFIYLFFLPFWGFSICVILYSGRFIRFSYTKEMKSYWKRIGNGRFYINNAKKSTIQKSTKVYHTFWIFSSELWFAVYVLVFHLLNFVLCIWTCMCKQRLLVRIIFLGPFL